MRLFVRRGLQAALVAGWMAWGYASTAARLLGQDAAAAAKGLVAVSSGRMVAAGAALGVALQVAVWLASFLMWQSAMYHRMSAQLSVLEARNALMSAQLSVLDARINFVLMRMIEPVEPPAD